MSVNERVVAASPEDVFAVLADGWTYGGWVVGAARIRDVDRAWPRPGCRIHHSVGTWPVLLHDVTTSELSEPPYRLSLEVRAWPTGSGRVDFVLEEHEQGCRITMREKPIAGPAKRIPAAVMDPMLHWRNTETLRRLAFLAEAHRDRRSASPGS
jgi:hypothetical protein